MYFIMYMISFLLGSFGIIGRVYDYYRFSKRKLNYVGDKEMYIMLFLNLLLPYSFCSYIFSSVNMNIVEFMISLVACFSVGYTLSDIFSPSIDELKTKNNPFINHHHKEDMSLRKEIADLFIRPFRNIYRSIFKKKYILEKLDCTLCEEDNHFKKKFNNLCKNAGLKDIELFFFEGSDKGWGYALFNPFFSKEKHSVFLSSYWCNKFNPDEVTALMAHELMHIKNKDGGVTSLFRPISFIITLLVSYMLFGYLGIFVVVDIPFVGALIAIIYVLLTIPVILLMIYLMTDMHGFWEQLSEIKADRYSCEIEGVTRDGLISLLTKLKRLDDKDLATYKWYEKIVLRYKVRPTHPNLEYRIRLIEHYKRWSVKDYFLLILSTIKWAVTGKGWNGR
ncbi:M56 family metallopeptidase [Paenibacillus jamilae]|nr:M56 family metallopeptidase [Paenibacillus jamilae]